MLLFCGATKSRQFCSLLAVVLGISWVLSGVAGGPPKRVLLVHSFGRDLTPLDMFAMDFRPELDRRLGGPISFYDVTLQPGGTDQPPQDEAIVKYINASFGNEPLDLVVTVGGPAAIFVHKYRQQLFPAVPTLFAAVDFRHLRNFVLDTNDASVPVLNDATAIVDDIRRLLPQTTTVFMVIGNTTLEQFWKNQMTEDLKRFQGQVQFVWLNTLSYEEMLKRCAALPRNSAIFYVGFTVDSNGVALTDARVLRELHDKANAPIFGQHSTQMGRGVVGGPMMSIDLTTRNAADVAALILHGEPAANLRRAPQPAGPPMYDARELLRWNIDEKRLPPESVVRFRQPTAWQQYKWQILAGFILLLIEGTIIAALATNLIRRRRAERKLAENRKRLRAVLETASEGIITVSDKGNIEAVNPAAEKIFGYTAAEMVGRPPQMLLANPSNFPAPIDNLTCELQGRRKDESLFPMDVAFADVVLDDRRLSITCIRDASERKRAEQLSREVAGRILQAQEAERARLARELHDDITQRLAQLAAETTMTNPYREPEQNPVSRTIVDGLRCLSEDVHSLAYRLHPAIWEHLGLEAGLKAECERFSRQESIAVNATVENLSPSIPHEIAVCVFRVTQEALNNVKRHAKANSAVVCLSEVDGGLQLSISDNGCGFNQGSVRLKPSLGLASMEERVRLQSGRFAVQTDPGHGTRILVWLPVSKDVQVCAITAS